MSFRKEHPSLHIMIQYVLINIFHLAQSQLNKEHAEERWEVAAGRLVIAKQAAALSLTVLVLPF